MQSYPAKRPKQLNLTRKRQVHAAVTVTAWKCLSRVLGASHLCLAHLFRTLLKIITAGIVRLPQYRHFLESYTATIIITAFDNILSLQQDFKHLRRKDPAIATTSFLGRYNK